MVTRALLELAAGFFLLALGGHHIVKGAINVALLMRVSTAVAGLTVVAFGTSLPELAVSLNAAAGSGVDIAYANVVGSNVFNLAVILAIVAMIRPVAIEPNTLKLQYPVMLGVTVLGVIVSWGGLVTHVEGAILTVALVAFVAGTVYFAKRGRAETVAAQYEHEVKEAGMIEGPASRQWTVGLLMIGGGILALWKGAEVLVLGAVTIAQLAGMSDRVIGLTVVAMGTSLPELAASIAASRHGDSKIIMGNLLGSNIFNILAILGITGLVHSVPVTARAISLDNWVQLGFTIALLPVMAIGHRSISRSGGAMLLGGFLVYLGALLFLG